MRTTTASLALIAAALLPRAAWAGLFVGNPPTDKLSVALMELSASKIEGVRCDGSGHDTLTNHTIAAAGSGSPLASGLASHCGYRLTDAVLVASGDEASGPGTFDLELHTPLLTLDVPSGATGADDLWIELDVGWEDAVEAELGAGHLDVTETSGCHDDIRDAWVDHLSLSL